VNQHRINSMLGEGAADFKGRGFLLADLREAMRSVSRTHKELKLLIASEGHDGGRFGRKELKMKIADEGDRLKDEDDNEPKRSTSFRHFVGITEIQANLLIGILNTSRAIQQESLDIWRNHLVNFYLPSAQSLTGAGRIEIKTKKIKIK